MPARRRVNKAKPAGEVAAMFLHSDGITPMLTGEITFRASPGTRWASPEAELRESERLASAAWDAHRALTWRHPWRTMLPPIGARWDGIRCTTWRHHHPTGRGQDWSVEEVQEAYEADVAAVEAFRKAKPRAAAEIAEELEQYLVDLRMLRAWAELFAHDHVAAGQAWQEYHVKRRQW